MAKRSLALAQGGLGLPAQFEVGEGEEHAGLVTQVHRLPGHDDEAGASVGQVEARLHLRNGAAAVEAGDRQVPVAGIRQDIDLVDAAADDGIAGVASHL